MRLYLLRHGEVASHRGDVPITPAAESHAFDVGRDLGRREPGVMLVLSGDTRRAMDTATHLVRGVTEVGGIVLGPRVAFALRNPDLYLAGTRVNMVSSAEALAEQVEGYSPADIDRVGFFDEFFASADRIGWWLNHESPPGETAAAIAARMRAFAHSLTDPIPGDPDAVVAVTHSPLLRALGLDLRGEDPGEPSWISGLRINVTPEGEMSTAMFPGEPT